MKYSIKNTSKDMYVKQEAEDAAMAYIKENNIEGYVLDVSQADC